MVVISAGFAIDEVVADNGESGVHTRLADRPEGKRLFDKLRAGDVLVVRWVDRLGRNYDDVCATIRAFMARGVVIRTVINGMTFDGSTADPMQQAVRDALIGFLAATAAIGPESSTPRAVKTRRILAASRRSRGSNSRRSAICSARARRASSRSPGRPA
jgi:putative DNA-invertase from lambdoid prophage Rac